jgi:hypothetical protein
MVGKRSLVAGASMIAKVTTWVIGKVISDVLQGGVAENPTTTPQLERDVGSRGEFRELPESNKTFSRANISALD